MTLDSAQVGENVRDFYYSVANPEFPMQRVPTSNILALFPENCMELKKKLDQEEHPSLAPFGSTNADVRVNQSA